LRVPREIKVELPLEIERAGFNALPMQIGTAFLESKDDEVAVSLNLQRQQLAIKGLTKFRQ
jgi:hypothetical protein